jgi:hypothetical protein
MKNTTLRHTQKGQVADSIWFAILAELLKLPVVWKINYLNLTPGDANHPKLIETILPPP